MDRIGCWLILGAAIMICGGVPAVAEQPAEIFTIAIVGSGETGGGAATPALAEAKRALTESLRALGARVTGRLIADTGSSPKVRQAKAAGRRASRTPSVDVVIGLSAKPKRRAGTYTAHLAMSLRAVLHAVEDDGPPLTIRARRERRLPTSCPKACVARISARMAREQARALASGIFRKAARMVSTTGRRLAFRGFSGQELGEIRQYLRVFPSFQRMGQGVRRAKDTVIRYQSRLDDRMLASALKKMLGHMGTPADITHRGRAYTVARVAGRVQPKAMPRQW
jgi:acetylornithine deacetylase/succinyl-diaminopimelate desuccinylase-like protein